MIDKLLEKMIYKRVISLSDFKKFAFLRNISLNFGPAVKQLMKLFPYLKIRHNFHAQAKLTQCTFIDLSKSFDKLDHLLLLRRSKSYRLRRPTGQLVRFYLSRRKQYEATNNAYSKLREFCFSVPKKPILDPPPFISLNNVIGSNQENAYCILNDTILGKFLTC